MELFEVILIEVVEKAARADGVTRNLEIVDVLIPVRPNVVYRCHAGHYTIATVRLKADTTYCGPQWPALR
jgi:hypothetical protein